MSYLILKMKQNGAWKTKVKKYDFYSFVSMHTKRISVESTILAWFRNISFLTYTHFSKELYAIHVNGWLESENFLNPNFWVFPGVSCIKIFWITRLFKINREKTFFIIDDSSFDDKMRGIHNRTITCLIKLIARDGAMVTFILSQVAIKSS